MGEGVKASVEVVNVALNCATPGQSAEHSLALVPPTHCHFPGHGNLGSKGGALQ